MTISSFRPRSLLVVLVLALVVPLAGGAVQPAVAVQQPLDVVVSANPAETTPHALDGRVYAIAQAGSMMVVGGSFSQIAEPQGNQVIGQPALFAFQRGTGAISNAFRPAINGQVDTVAVSADGQSVFVGGAFSQVNGQTQRRLVKLDLATGQIDPAFDADPNARVTKLVLRGDRLYVAGAFTSISGTSRTILAALDPVTGAVLPDVAPVFSGPDGGGALNVYEMDVTPDGTQLVAIGNFNTVDGQSRHQAVLLDVASSPAQVSSWQTTAYHQDFCASVFDTYMRDVDISPDGSYMVIVTTGAYRANQLCDTAARWELGTTGPNQQPTWVSYTGGDTLYGVAVTGEAIYIGGHQRWVNNPFAGDAPGPGAVPREGLAALDPRNGLPLSWDPGRARGVGVFDMVAADEGVYMGSDSEAWGRYEYHARLALFPTSGGAPIPEAVPGPVPGILHQAPALARPTDPSVLHRVNAGGPTLTAADRGIDWSGDQATTSPVRNSGSNASTWPAVPSVDATVPATTPAAVFESERWDPSAEPEMHWQFPVASGREVEVRLYFANRCSCTDGVGERSFDVAVEGDVVLDDLDLVAAVGDDVGTMRAVTVTSDGTIDVELGHVVENPLVNAIEIVDPALVGDGDDDPVALETRDFDGAGVGPATLLPGPMDWSTVRGAFLLSGRLYTGGADGNLYARDFDGTDLGPAEAVELYGLGAAQFPIANLTGMTFDPVTGRLYYTLRGQDTLWFRHFLPESDVVGAQTFVASGPLAGVDWSSVRGLHLDVAGQRLYHGGTDGVLRALAFAADGPVAGTSTAIAGPGIDGTSWHAAGLFTGTSAGTTLPNQPPDAQVTSSCSGSTCTFGSTGTSDPDGTVVEFEWDFGDGSTATGPGVTHTFDEGTWTVTLTVTDDDGATDTTTTVVDIASPPVADFDVTCSGLTCSFDASASGDHAPLAGYAWEFGDGQTGSGTPVEHTYAASGTVTVRLTVTGEDGLTDSLERELTVSEVAEEVTFVGLDAVTANRNDFVVTVPDEVANGDLLLLYASVNNTTTGGGEPVGVGAWDLVDTVVAGNLRTTVWSRVADGSESSRPVTVETDRWVKGDVVVAAYRGTSPDAPILASAGVAETLDRADHTTPELDNPMAGAWAVSYWADRTSATTDWTPPAGEVVRHEGLTGGGGRISGLLTDSGGPADDPAGGLTAVADSADDAATMWTVLLAPSTGEPLPGTPPEADAAVSCTDLSCTFDATASSDADGTVVGHSWTAGDGTVLDGDVVTHTYASEGSFEVALTVTDDDGLSDSDVATAVVAATPTAVVSVSCDDLVCAFDGSGSSDVSGAVQNWAWVFGDGTVGSGASVSHTYGAAGSYAVSLTVTDDEGQTATSTSTVVVDESGDPGPVAPVEFVGVSGSNGNGTSQTVSVPAGVAAGDALLLFVSVNQATVTIGAPTGVSGWTEMDTVVSNSMMTRVLSRVAQAGDAGSSVTVPMSGWTKADVALVAYTGTDVTAPVHVFDGVDETVYRAEHTTPEVVSSVDGARVVSYWADKTSGTTSWAVPAGVTQRYAGFGSASGRISALLADHGPVGPGTVGGLTAVADETNQKATMWTFVLTPRS